MQRSCGSNPAEQQNTVAWRVEKFQKDIPQNGAKNCLTWLLDSEKKQPKHPGGWETALAVEHFLKRNSSGAVVPYTFYDRHYLKFSRGKLNDFEGMSWYLQGFVVVAGWKPFPCSSLACHFSKRLLRARPVRLRKSVEFPWCHRHCQILIP